MPRKDVDQDPQHVPSKQQSPLMLQSENVMQLNHTDLNQVWGGEPTSASQTSNADPRGGRPNGITGTQTSTFTSNEKLTFMEPHP